LFGGDPGKGPVRLALHSRHCLDGVEQVVPLMRIPDVSVDQHTVHFRVHVLHGDLEAIEAPSLRDLHLLTEALHQVLVHDAIGCGKEGQHVRDEVTFVVLQAVPVGQVLGQIHLLHGPERGLSL